MAVVSHRYRYLFILNPRTGCTAIANGALIPTLEGAWVPSEDMQRDGILVEKKHTSLAELLEADLITSEQRRTLTVFAGVRNPFDSLVSLYVKIVRNYAGRIESDPGHFFLRNSRARQEAKVAAEEGFNAWMLAKHWKAFAKPPVQFHAKWMEGVDQFVRFEHLQEDFRAVCERLDMPCPEVPVMNVTIGRDEEGYRSYYDTKSKELVETIFAPTLEQFGYEF